jgi:UDP-N-acetylglucosamine pyrophosphorylase
MVENTEIRSVILAAGKGTRMKSEHPKVATLLNGKPLIRHVLDNLYSAGIKTSYVIVGYKKEIVIDICKDYPNITFIEQKEQLGTGHAVLCAESELSNYKGSLLIACGDVPLIAPKSFLNLIQFHSNNSNKVSVLSCEVSEPKGYGRIIRDKSQNLLEIVEEKDSSDIQKLVKEINTGTYVFQSPDVFTDLKNVNKENAQGEYYLPDLIKIANSKGEKTGAIKLLNHLESSGVNSPEDLARLESFILEGKVAI